VVLELISRTSPVTANQELEGGLLDYGVASPKVFSNELNQQKHNGKGCYWVKEKLIHRG
jgi:hypothetical protein